MECDPKCMLRSRCALKMNYCKSRISIYLQVYFCTLEFIFLMCKWLELWMEQGAAITSFVALWYLNACLIPTCISALTLFKDSHTQSSNLRWRLNSSAHANPPARDPLWKGDYYSCLPKFHILLGACQDWDCLSCWTLSPCVQSCVMASSASWVPPVDALISTELRKITCKHSGRKILVVGLCMVEERPAHDDSRELWDGEPDPALDPCLFPSLQGLSIMLLSDLFAADSQLTIYFPMSSYLSCSMKPLSLLGILSTSVQAFHSSEPARNWNHCGYFCKGTWQSNSGCM